MHAKQFILLAVWLNSVLALRAPAKLNSRVSRLLHVCVFTISIVNETVIDANSVGLD